MPFNITTPVNTSCQLLFQTKGNSTASLQGDADIAGIGVISSFIISAYLSLAVAIVCYPRLLPDYLLNDYDRLFIRARPAKSMQSFQALREGISTFSDSQILQGIAILVAGFANIRSLTVYHWQMVVYLAWMSSNVHLTTLTFLRDHLQKEKKLRVLRLTGMLILLLLLVVAFIPTSTRNWTVAVVQSFDRGSYPDRTDPDYPDAWYGLNFAMPVRCFWVSPFNGHGEQDYYMRSGINPDAPFTYIILVGSYIWKIWSMFRHDAGVSIEPKGESGPGKVQHQVKAPWIKRFALTWLMKRAKKTAQRGSSQIATSSGRHHRNLPSRRSIGNKLLLRLTLVTYAGTLAIFDFLASFLASIWVLSILLIWGTLEITSIRHKSQALPRVHDEENKWSFGQILPMLLLIAPLTTTLNFALRDKHRADFHRYRRSRRAVLQQGKTTVDSVGKKQTQSGESNKRRSWASTAPAQYDDATHPHEGDNVSPLLDAHTTSRQVSPSPSLTGVTYEQMDRGSERKLSHPTSSLIQYLVSLGNADPDLDIVSKDFFYRSWIFRSLLLLPNIICTIAAVILFSLSLRASTENIRKYKANGGFSLWDPKGNVWILGLYAVCIGSAIWIVWVTIAMFLSRLFRSRKH